MRIVTKHLLLLGLLFTLSRAILYPMRPFWYDPIQHFMQYLDPEVLRHNLWHGLLHLHTQPPFFNLFLGIVLKLAPGGAAPSVFAAIYFLSGLGTVLCLYVLLRELGVSGRLAVAVAFAYSLLPSVIQAERWLFYAAPLAGLIVASVWALHRNLATRRPGWGALFLLLCVGMALTRSFFHVLLWMTPVVGAVTVYAARERRRVVGVVLCSTLALLAAGSVYMKNCVVHGVFTASTWQGMSLAKMTRYVDKADVEGMIRSGAVTPLARIPCFAEPGVYVDYYRALSPTGVDILDNLVKSNGEPNWNHIVYVRASKEYQRNTVRIIKRHPLAYLKAVVNQVYLFFGLRSHVYFDDPAAWPRIGGRISLKRVRESLILFVAPLGYAVLFAGAMIGFGRRLRAGWQGGDPAAAGVCLYSLFILAYVFGLACLAELGEGCYMRMPIDGLLLVGCAMIKRW